MNSPANRRSTDPDPIESATLTCLSQSGKGWYFQFVMRFRAPNKRQTACCVPVRRMVAAFELRFGRGLVSNSILKGGQVVRPNGAEPVHLVPSENRFSII